MWEDDAKPKLSTSAHVSPSQTDVGGSWYSLDNFVFLFSSLNTKNQSTGMLSSL